MGVIRAGVGHGTSSWPEAAKIVRICWMSRVYFHYFVRTGIHHNHHPPAGHSPTGTCARQHGHSPTGTRERQHGHSPTDTCAGRSPGLSGLSSSWAECRGAEHAWRLDPRCRGWWGWGGTHPHAGTIPVWKEGGHTPSCRNQGRPLSLPCGEKTLIAHVPPPPALSDPPPCMGTCIHPPAWAPCTARPHLHRSHHGHTTPHT